MIKDILLKFDWNILGRLGISRYNVRKYNSIRDVT